MPNIRAVQQQRREEAAKEPKPVPVKEAKPKLKLPDPAPDVLYPYPGTTEAAPTIPVPTVRTPRVEQFAAYPQGGVGGLARLLQAAGTVASAKTAAQRYASHLRKLGADEVLVRQMTNERYVG